MAHHPTRRAALIGAAAFATAAAAPDIAAPNADAAGVKIIALLARRSGTSREDFQHAWMHDHAGKASTIPGLIGYAVEDVTAGPSRDDISHLTIDATVDGIAEFRFATIDGANTGLQSAAGQAWLREMAGFVGSAKTFAAHEDIIVTVDTSPPPQLRNYAILNRKPGMTTAVFRNDWHKVHGDMAIHVPYLRGFVLADVFGDVDSSLQAVEIPIIPTESVDGIAEAYFDSTEDQAKMRQTPEAKAWFAQGAATFGRLASFNARETVILSRSA